MEKKTIGSFIAALRKANGLTQKQLAEKLNVSDKAVSRWERDEAMPDLSLIPELADIFNVTTDEILRGARKNPESAELPSKEKSEKQRKRLLADKKTKYRIRSTFSIGIALLGLIAAMICNFGFLRAYIGFMAGTVFYVAAAVCQICFMIQNLSGLDEDLLTEEELINYREHTIHLARGCFTTIFLFLASNLPLLVFPYDTYQGITAGTWLGYGLLFAVIGFFICLGTSCAVESVLTKKELINIKPRQKALQALKAKFLKIGSFFVAGLIICQLCLLAFLPDVLRQGIRFDNWDSFKAYMETPTDPVIYVDYDTDILIGMDSETVIAQTETIEEIFYDEDGNEITAPLEEVVDANGNVLCTYYPRNGSVSGLSFNLEDSNNPQIIVYTTAENRRVNWLMDEVLMPLYCFLYPISFVCLYLSYRKKARCL